MKLEPIVLSLLDTDLYKFNMDQVIFHKHTDLNGEYHFKCRNENVRFTQEMLEEINEEPTVFEQEYFPERVNGYADEPYTVTYDEEEEEYVVEGPRIEKMLGYTNLESEKGFTFFQNFLKDTGILDELEALGIQEGDTVRMYGLSFDYYKS